MTIRIPDEIVMLTQIQIFLREFLKRAVAGIYSRKAYSNGIAISLFVNVYTVLILISVASVEDE